MNKKLDPELNKDQYQKDCLVLKYFGLEPYGITYRNYGCHLINESHSPAIDIPEKLLDRMIEIYENLEECRERIMDLREALDHQSR